MDAVVLNHSRKVAGVTELCLNSIDVLTGLETVKICVAYELHGKRIDYYPASFKDIADCTPIYEELPGWNEDITQAKEISELPINAQNYIQRVSELVKLPLATFSVGPDREQTIVLKNVWQQPAYNN